MSGAAGRAPEVVAAVRPGGRRGLLTAVGLSVFLLGSVIAVAAKGLFLSRDVVFLWVMLGLLAVSLSDINGYLRGVIRDWLPFFGALFVYDLLRGVLADSIFAPHTFPQIRVDEALFAGQVPTVWLQERLFDASSLAPYDFAAWAVYLTHFFAVFVVAAYLWRQARPSFRRFRNLILALTAAAFVTYALFPAVPPWLASDAGDLGQSGRVVGAVWAQLGVGPAAAIWEKGSGFSNEVAAVPSLHTAYPVMILLFFWPGSTWRGRALWLAYALAMSITLVYSGEHYVADVLLGWVYAGVTYVAVERVAALRRGRRALAGAEVRPT